MADSGTVSPRPSDGAAASATFQLEVNTIGGTCLAAIRDAQGSWQLGDVMGRLPEVLPGHRYKLLQGEAVLAPGTAIAEWARPVDGKACVTAVVVVRTQEEQRLDMRLIEAADALDVSRVCKLLRRGADATWFQKGYKRCRHDVATALHAAVERPRPRRRPGDGEDWETARQEEEDRLLAVMGALLSARADVDARRKQVYPGGALITCALHSAVLYGSLGPVRVLLDARASIDAVGFGHLSLPENEHKFTALHEATQAGNLPLVALLLERGADVNAIRQSFVEDRLSGEPAGGPAVRHVRVRETALHVAAAGGHQALVALLVQAGADASIALSQDGQDTSLEELCAGRPGMLEALGADSSAALLAGGVSGAEVEAALAAFAGRHATP